MKPEVKDDVRYGLVSPTKVKSVLMVNSSLAPRKRKRKGQSEEPCKVDKCKF